MTDLTPIAGTLAKAIRMLASDKDGDVVAAWHAIIRTLKGIGADIHDVADCIEHSSNGALSEHEMREIFDAGVKTGIKQAEQKHNNQSVTAQFPSGRDIALYCYQRIDRLNEWEQEFVTNMMIRTQQQKPLYPKQQNKLEQIYVQLGGRI